MKLHLPQEPGMVFCFHEYLKTFQMKLNETFRHLDFCYPFPSTHLSMNLVAHNRL